MGDELVKEWKKNYEMDKRWKKINSDITLLH